MPGVFHGSRSIVVQAGANYFVHQDPITKSQRITNSAGAVTEAIELDPFGGETNRSTNPTWHKQRYTTWERDWTGDESLFRRYHGWWSKFAHPDPYDGSYDLSDPQSLNRYSYVQSDPVNFVDPSGLGGPGDHDNTRLIPCVILDGIDTCQGLRTIPNAFVITQYYHRVREGGIFSWWLTPLQQNPGPVNVRQIISNIKKQEARIQQARKEFEDCVKNNPKV